jgi:hypothetical protein
VNTSVNTNMMGLIEIIYAYQSGMVTLGELERWTIIHLQETMDRMALVNLISGGTIAVDMGDITEEDFKKELFESPALKRFGDDRPSQTIYVTATFEK